MGKLGRGRVVDAALFALLVAYSLVFLHAFWVIWLEGSVTIGEPWRGWLAFEMVLMVAVAAVSGLRLWAVLGERA